MGKGSLGHLARSLARVASGLQMQENPWGRGGGADLSGDWRRRRRRRSVGWTEGAYATQTDFSPETGA